MNNRQAREITQKTETEEIRDANQFNSNVKLHPKMTYGAFVMNYIEELQTEINRLSKENVYLQSDEYLNTIFPTNYIQELKDKIDALEKENELLKKTSVSNLNAKLTVAGDFVSDSRATIAGDLNLTTNRGGYNQSYVKGLQEELKKLTEENFYLKSEEYQKKVSSKYSQEKTSQTSVGDIDSQTSYTGNGDQQLTYGGYNHSYVKGLQEELTQLTEENVYLKSDEYQNKISGKYVRDKKAMTRKIQRLSLLIQQLSYDSTEREGILASLKQILDNKSDEVIRTTQGSFDTSL